MAQVSPDGSIDSQRSQHHQLRQLARNSAVEIIAVKITAREDNGEGRLIDLKY